jgi:hypothetical protein
LFFEGIKFYDAALPGVEQFHTFARLTVYNSPQGPLQGNPSPDRSPTPLENLDSRSGLRNQ